MVLCLVEVGGAGWALIRASGAIPWPLRGLCHPRGCSPPPVPLPWLSALCSCSKESSNAFGTGCAPSHSPQQTGLREGHTRHCPFPGMDNAQVKTGVSTYQPITGAPCSHCLSGPGRAAQVPRGGSWHWGQNRCPWAVHLVKRSDRPAWAWPLSSRRLGLCLGPGTSWQGLSRVIQGLRALQAVPSHGTLPFYERQVLNELQLNWLEALRGWQVPLGPHASAEMCQGR